MEKSESNKGKSAPIPTIRFDPAAQAIVIVDQTLLPNREEEVALKDQKSIWDAIYRLQVRGAPAIGVAAAYGIYLAANQISTESFDEFLKEFRKAKDYLNSSRPTAVNLSWALRRMEDVVLNHKDQPIAQIKQALFEEARKIEREDTQVCRKIGENGFALLHPHDGVLTHCNAGRLAATNYGTATAPVYYAQERGCDLHVYCDETRPLLQGARLTAYELNAAGVETTLLCDNMAPSLMKSGRINIIFVGCDRVAKNGDAANKIGTSYVAIAAQYYKIPFYVCAPTSTIDLACADGSDICIEQRPAEEVTEMWYKERMAPEGIDVFNPAFDVTDAKLITGIITEYGIAYPPYEESFAEIFKKKESGEFPL